MARLTNDAANGLASRERGSAICWGAVRFACSKLRANGLASCECMPCAMLAAGDWLWLTNATAACCSAVITNWGWTPGAPKAPAPFMDDMKGAGELR